MNDLTIRQIVVRGHGKTDSIIDLEPGVNVILGPSNTGKSMVVDCIDYLFGGSTPPFNPDETGYSSVKMTLANALGEGLHVARDIECSEGEERAAGIVTVVSSIPGIGSGTYSTRNSMQAKGVTYGDILLKLIGIDDRIEIIKNQIGKGVLLTPRTFFHQLCLKEGDIFKEETILADSNRSNNITPSINALAYLLYEGGTCVEKVEDPKIKEAKKNAVITYIGVKASSYDERRDLLRSELEESEESNIEAMIAAMVEESASIEKKIIEARRESQSVLSEIYEVTQQLEETRFLQERYRKLHSQYDSDIQRLRFIVEGEQNSDLGSAEHCPFCDGLITNEGDRESYTLASKAEMTKVQKQIVDLGELEQELVLKMAEHESRLATLDQKKSSIQDLISTSFQPKMDELHDELGRYRSLVEMRQELTILDSLYEDLQSDLYGKIMEEDDSPKFDAKRMFKPDYFANLSGEIGTAIKQCKYPGYESAVLSSKSFDVVVNNKDKRYEGKGYRAFLNSIFAFTLMKFIESDGRHAPKTLILDSPILPLKEGDGVRLTDNMKASLFSFMIDNCGDCQVIIAENELPDGLDHSSINLIEFTKGLNGGRYGFLQDPQQAKS